MVSFLADVAAEVARAEHLEGAGHLNFWHEGYAVLAEELEEIWTLVRAKGAGRDPRALYRECVQLAAMAARMALDYGAREAEPDGT